MVDKKRQAEKQAVQPEYIGITMVGQKLVQPEERFRSGFNIAFADRLAEERLMQKHAETIGRYPGFDIRRAYCNVVIGTRDGIADGKIADACKVKDAAFIKKLASFRWRSEIAVWLQCSLEQVNYSLRKFWESPLQPAFAHYFTPRGTAKRSEDAFRDGQALPKKGKADKTSYDGLDDLGGLLD